MKINRLLQSIIPFLMVGLVFAAVLQFGGTQEVQAVSATTLTVDTFTSTGVWIAPTGITSVNVEAWGAGGGGTSFVGGGGGGAYVSSTVAVSPGNAYYVVVGASAAADTNGVGSTFATTTVVAAPGLSGTNGGLGGTTLLSTGDTEFAGGDGVIVFGNAGGGGSAGDTGAGGAGSGATNGIGGTSNGGAGGNNNAVGSVPGGGGGAAAGAGRASARGEVRVTYRPAADSNFPIIEKRSWGRDASPTANSVHTLTLPSNIVAGDLLLAIITTSDNGPVTIPAGDWTLLGQAKQGTNLSQTVFYKVAAGGDVAVASTTNAINASHVVFEISNYSGVPTGTSASSTGSATIDPPSHNSGSSKKYLWIATGGQKQGINTSVFNAVTSAPTNFSSLITELSGNLNNLPITAVSNSLNETQTLDPGTFANDSSSWSSWTIAIAPAAAASPPTGKKQSEFFFE